MAKARNSCEDKKSFCNSGSQPGWFLSRHPGTFDNVCRHLICHNWGGDAVISSVETKDAIHRTAPLNEELPNVKCDNSAKVTVLRREGRYKAETFNFFPLFRSIMMFKKLTFLKFRKEFNDFCICGY